MGHLGDVVTGRRKQTADEIVAKRTCRSLNAAPTGELTVLPPERGLPFENGVRLPVRDLPVEEGTTDF